MSDGAPLPSLDLLHLFEELQCYQSELREVLHDGLCQSLSSALLMAHAMVAQNPSEPSAAFQELAGLIETAIDNAREVSRRLRPIGAEPSSLMEGLAALADNSEVPCTFVCEEPCLAPDAIQSLAIYRLAETALAQSRKEGPVRISLLRNSDLTTMTIAAEGKPRWQLRPLGILALVAGAELTEGSGFLEVSWPIFTNPK